MRGSTVRSDTLDGSGMAGIRARRPLAVVLQAADSLISSTEPSVVFDDLVQRSAPLVCDAARAMVYGPGAMLHASTSGCRRTVTGCLPTVLIWPGTSTARRSSAGPPAARTASTTSAAVTEPNSRPESPAAFALTVTVQAAQLGCDLAGVPEVADLARLAGPTDRVDLLLRAAGGHDRQPARKQVVAAVAVLDLDDVAGRAEIGHVTGEDELHDVPSPQRAVEV